MASNKNQHFVPKVYLRRFSPDPDQASINLFNLSRRRAILQASIGGQCSSNYFYGEKNKYEDRLQLSEGLYGDFLIALDNSELTLNREEMIFLRHFVYLQYTRTAAQAERMRDFMVSMTNIAFDDQPPQEFVPNAKETAREGLERFMETQHLIDDLKVRLVRNRTSVDFIASDNPSVLTNRWHLQSLKAGKKSPGLSSAGAMFLMPITPRYLCVLYDGDVYATEHKSGWIDVKSECEIRALNEHQYLNCQANVYFKNWDRQADVVAGYEPLAARRPMTRHEVITAVLDKSDAWGETFRVVPIAEARQHEKTLIHTKEVFPVPTRWPSFLRIRNTPTIYTNGTGTGFVRAWSLKQGGYSGTNYRKLK